MENLLISNVLDSDSYKFSHAKQYPPNTTAMFSYFESRGGDDKLGTVDYTVFFGLQYYLKRYLSQRITIEQVEEAKEFSELHGVPFNYEGWMYIAKELKGKLPVRIRSVPEGTKVPKLNILMSVESTDPKCFWIVSWLETMLVRIWYPVTVATYSYECKQIIRKYLDETSDCIEDEIDFKLHDFGSRGATSQESAMIGGAAHLVNFLGSDTIAGVWMANKYYNERMSGFSIPACYDDKTDILTSKGWKRFKDLLYTDKVAQYNKDGTVNFVIPTKFYVEKANKMIRFTTESTTAGCDLLVTPNHRMVRKSISTGKLEIQKAEDALFSHRNYWLQGGVASCGKQNISNVDRLKIAFQADGSFPSRDAYDGSRYGATCPIRFSLKKIRKIKRLQMLLAKTAITYNTSKHKPDRTYFWIKSNTKMSKVFDWINLDNISSKWCREFIEEVALWDGTRKYNSIIYTSIVEKNADMVQAVAILAGYRAAKIVINDMRDDHDRKELYQINISTKANYRVGAKIKRSPEEYAGNVYCVSVPSKMLVVRRNGFVSVSGNSEHSTITMWGKENEVDAYRNMIKQYGDGAIFACVSDSYNIYYAAENLWGRALKKEVEEMNATLVVRPDSGNVVEIVCSLLVSLDRNFGSTINTKGFKVLNNVRVIQGDGIDKDDISIILFAAKRAGYSATNIAFGMGGGLVQKDMNRDTHKFAFKCSWAKVNGKEVEVYKDPITDKGKVSKKGKLDLIKEDGIFFKTVQGESDKSELVTVFENGEVIKEWTLQEIRERLNNS